MGFGVFIHRQDSIYDDSPAERYQFPHQYLTRVQACIGDWILYYEPVKTKASRGYFAVAKVERVVPDPTGEGLYLALIKPGSYLDFVDHVPFRDSNGLLERGLLNEQGDISGRAQAAVRPISSADFRRILERGLHETAPLLPRSDEQPAYTGFGDGEQTPFTFEVERERVDILTSRPLRDRLFRRLVLKAYDERCAITSLKLINGGGRAEVDAAHIRPVEANGPDTIGNGIALSGTAHWMFDRGLIGLTDDLGILISRHVNDPETVRAFINRDGRARPPLRAADRPHPRFLAWHREHCFKG